MSQSTIKDEQENSRRILMPRENGAHKLRDNGGRRSGIERRRFSYSQHVPERRSCKDRRKGGDRRDETRGGKETVFGRRLNGEDRRDFLPA